MKLVAGVLVLTAAPAVADSTAVSFRVSAAVGELGEVTWSAPEVDLALRLPAGARGFVVAEVGYSTLDNHTFLSDGEDIRFEVSGGARVSDRLRASGGLGLELIAFHADPDVETQHPGVDQLVHRRGTIPSANAALTYAIGASTTSSACSAGSACAGSSCSIRRPAIGRTRGSCSPARSSSWRCVSARARRSGW